MSDPHPSPDSPARGWGIAGLAAAILSAIGVVAGLLSLLELTIFGSLSIVLGIVGFVRGARVLGAMAMVLGGLELAYFVWALLSFAA